MTGAKLWEGINFTNKADVYKYFNEYKDGGYKCNKEENVCVVECFYDKIITNFGNIVPDFKQFEPGYDLNGNVIYKAPSGAGLRNDDGFANKEQKMNNKRGTERHTDKELKNVKTEIHDISKLSFMMNINMQKETNHKIDPAFMRDHNWWYVFHRIGAGSVRLKSYEMVTEKTGFYRLISFDPYDYCYVDKLIDTYQKGELYCWVRFYGYDKPNFWSGSTPKITHVQKIYFSRKTDPINKIGLVGCYMTCFADIISYYKGVLTRPRDVNEVVNKFNLYAHNDSSEIDSWNVAKRFQLKSTFNDYKHDVVTREEIATRDALHDQIILRINENKPTVFRINKGKDDTHFIVVIGARYEGKDDKKKPLYYIVNDPGSSDPKNKYISLETMISPNKDRPVTKINFFDKMI